jgi:hypothetical protein
MCLKGFCVPGNCATSNDCAAGQLCGQVAKNFCGACTDDSQCKNDGRYGSGYICAAGSCVQGDCHNDGDCSTGHICGVTSPNHCGDCTTDTQCKNDTTYGQGFVCNVGQGTCVSSSCSPDDTTCSQNSADFCCASKCVAGNCCTAADCASLGKNYTCAGNTCTQCALPPGNVYYVDPVNGSDTVGTGNNSTPSCAFQSITRALAVIGNTATAGTEVLIVPSGPLGTATGETFPISVPMNVTIGGTGGSATILVPKGGNGFTMIHPASGLHDLVIDGQAQQAGIGISVSTGSATSTTLTHVTVQNMNGDGIAVGNAGRLTIGEGVSSIGNGVPTDGVTEMSEGLQVSGTARVVISVTAGDPVHFDGNAASGIYVYGAGAIALNGTPDVGGAGTITANKNGHSGIWIEQEAAGVAIPPVNLVTGLVAWANAHDGIHVAGGSSLTLRNSYLLSNQDNGVLVVTHVVGALRTNTVNYINLGTTNTSPPSYGGNVLQASTGSGPNLGAGICVNLDPVNATLNAAGNIFAGPTDCRAGVATLISNGTCSNAVDYSVMPNGGTAATIDKINVTMCK